MTDVTLKVDGMACSGCASAVENAVKKVAPEAGVSVDLAAGTVAITGAPTRAIVEAAIIKAGYEVAA